MTANDQQTLAMAQDIARAVQVLRHQFPQAVDVDAMWLAMLAMHGNRAVERLQALSVNVARSDL